jgi:hypothetical protein
MCLVFLNQKIYKNLQELFLELQKEIVFYIHLMFQLKQKEIKQDQELPLFVFCKVAPLY